MRRRARLTLTARRWRILARKRERRDVVIYFVDGQMQPYVPDVVWQDFAMADACKNRIREEEYLQMGMSHFIQTFPDVLMSLHDACWTQLSDLAQQYRATEGVAYAACRYFAARIAAMFAVGRAAGNGGG